MLTYATYGADCTVLALASVVEADPAAAAFEVLSKLGKK